MPLQETSGAASYDAFGAGVADRTYIEDVFSTWIYTGNGSSQTITNGIALADGATNGTVLQLSNSLTDSAPVPSSVTNVNSGVSVVSSPTKFGSGAFSFVPANNGWLYTVLSKQLNIYENFCIDFWQNSSSPDETTYVCGTVSNSSDQWLLRASNGSMRFWISSTTYMTASLPTANQWNHIALTGDGTTVRLFYNGSLASSVATSSLLSGGNRLIGSTPQLLFGASVGGGTKMNGYMDDIRVTVNRSVYTSAFTAPNDALPLDTLAKGYGGMVWVKSRTNAGFHAITDTARGVGQNLYTNSTLAQSFDSTSLTAFSSSGFSLGLDAFMNGNGQNYASWTFRKCPKFFDVVTWTGNGTGDRTISHNLGSVPGCIITKATSAAGTNWHVFHRSINAGRYGVGYLNATNEFATGSSFDWDPTATTFVADAALSNNDNGVTYVAYLFAHNAGGFGLSGTDNVISCGSYVGTGNTAGIGGSLGWEPQWIMIKNTTSAADWVILDNMRGMNLLTSYSLAPNTSAADVVSPRAYPYQFGFNLPSANISVNQNGSTYIYVAIRRGPMRRPTSGISVFSPTLTDTNSKVTTGFPVDFQIFDRTSAQASMPVMISRLTGFQYRVAATSVEQSVGTGSNPTTWDSTGFTPISTLAGSTFHSFRRAPGFLDTVIYGGNGTTQVVAHGLGVPPELIIFRYRNVGVDTSVLSIHINNNNTSWTSDQQLLNLNLANAKIGVGADWLGNNTSFIAPTATTFTVGQNGAINQSGGGYTAFLFASVPGVSKIGRYTGNGTSQTIDCGFTAGARFVLIKRLDFNNHWHVFDTARGIVAGNDPFNNFIESQADISSEDCIDPDNSGFIVNQTAIGQLNADTATYLYFAIA
jgi:hypothetical protein